MEEIRKSAKTVDDAIAAALADLGAAREEVDITVIDEGSKGFLGMFGQQGCRCSGKEKLQSRKGSGNLLKRSIFEHGADCKNQNRAEGQAPVY